MISIKKIKINGIINEIQNIVFDIKTMLNMLDVESVDSKKLLEKTKYLKKLQDKLNTLKGK